MPNNSFWKVVRRIACSLTVTASVILTSPLAAQNPLEVARQRMTEAVLGLTTPASRLTDGPQMRRLFRQVVRDASESTVRVRANGRTAGLGTVIDADGWIVTKASEVEGPNVTCRLHDGRELEARLAGVNDQYDLALLKVEAAGLPAIRYADADDLSVGQWVASAGTGEEPLAVGVIGVGPRKIEKQSGLLGVVLEDGDGGPRIAQVMAGSGAEEAGIIINDVVTHLNGKPIKDRQQLVTTVRKYGPGDNIELTVRRGEKSLKLRATLSRSVEGFPINRGEVQNNMGGKLSGRRHGFPSALQHDGVLRPSECGGPLVNLDGRAVGMNIARAGRTETFAIPVKVLEPLVAELMASAQSAQEADASVGQ